MNILVIRLSALGDVAMTIPAVYSVARAYPQHSFYVLTSSFCGRLFVNRPENVIPLLPPSASLHGFTGTWRLMTSLWSLPVDAVADLHNVMRSWVLDWSFFVRGVPTAMLNKQRSERKDILRHKAKAQPFTLRYLHVFRKLGFPAEMTFTSLYADTLPPWPASIPHPSGTLKVGIAPFARYATKTYPVELMREVIQALNEKHDADIYLFGARGAEARQLRLWEQELSRVHCVAARLPIEEELALMAHLDVMLTMDSANMHLASLAGTRVVSLWGATTPACGFLGYGQREEDAIDAQLACQPCSIAGGKSCPRGDFACMYDLKTDAIIKRLLLLS